jgi:F0F1-type ATP synthase membrane subunit b/b'
MEIDLLKEAKQQLLKVKGKPQKIIDELNQQIERDIQEITQLREQLQRKRTK